MPENVEEIIGSIFTIEDEFLEYNVPSFYIVEAHDLKKRFLALLKELDAIGYLASMRKVNERLKIQVFKRPLTKPSDRRVSLALLFATMCTTFISGLTQSTNLKFPYLSAALFMVAIMSILGLHEVGHKSANKKYGLDSAGPYFIPGPPPLGTFGAVIIQKSAVWNKDALFDLGARGPIIGFIISVMVTIVGLPFSELNWVKFLPSSTLNIPILYEFLGKVLLRIPPNPQNFPNLLITLHPVAFAGYVGLIITMLNLIPVGQLDGGHIAFCFLEARSRRILGFIALGFLFISGYWFFALFALFNMQQRHPEPLDNVSKVSYSRKIFVLGVIVIFILSTISL